MDLYPDIFYRAFPKTTLLKPVLNKFINKGLNGAKKIVVIGKCMEERIIEKGVPREKIVYFPNFSGVQRNQYPERNNPSTFHIVYAGNIGFAHDLRTLISTAKKLEGTGLEVTIIGKGVNYAKTKEFALKSEVNNIRLLSNVDDETFAHILGNADMHFINLKEEFNGLIVPSKYYTALKLGVPVLYEGPKGSEIFREIVDNKMGCAIENRDSESMEETLRKLLNQSIKFNREKIIKHYNQHYAIGCRIKHYYNSLTNHSS